MLPLARECLKYSRQISHTSCVCVCVCVCVCKRERERARKQVKERTTTSRERDGERLGNLRRKGRKREIENERGNQTQCDRKGR